MRILPELYWLAQFVFAVVFLLVVFSAEMSMSELYGFASFQFVLVGWRLWGSGRWLWLALVPPASTMAVWWLLMRWAIADDATMGGDGGGLLAAMASIVWCVIVYLAVGMWAGLRPEAALPTKRS